MQKHQIHNFEFDSLQASPFGGGLAPKGCSGVTSMATMSQDILSFDKMSHSSTNDAYVLWCLCRVYIIFSTNVSMSHYYDLIMPMSHDINFT